MDKPGHGMSVSWILLPVVWLTLAATPAVGAVTPYIQVDAGIQEMDILEEGPSLDEFKFEGNAVTTFPGSELEAE